MANDDTETPLGRIRFLARAESRVRIVESLLESSPASSRELRDHLDASRTTVSRAVRSLEEQGWVTRGDGAYRLTPVGQVIAREFLALLETVRTAEERSEFLQWFPTDVPAPDLVGIEDAEITVPTDGDPYTPARTQAEILRSADQLRMLLPSIDIEATKLLTDQVVNHGLEIETVIAPTLEATVESADFAPLFRRKMQTDRSTVLVSDRDLPLYVGLAGDGRVQIGVEDDDGFPRALLETSDPSIREWGEAIYEEYRQEAREKPQSEF